MGMKYSRGQGISPEPLSKKLMTSAEKNAGLIGFFCV